MSVNEYIVIDPDICNGKPTVKGTRITVQTVLEFLAAGESQDGIIKNYPRLTSASIQACIQFSMHRIANVG
jgi:uncharacterized protein (DUF433 family)